ncbi:hypothetical protein [Streptoalloteichus hindustanus]|uniref:Uncharacterized protein n=1 Tax=Streptoalloteichus hindustanus TaxID=2017 RepID=A0A1M5K779_STRHI|nr:hypothetical protein [Streptoalloteichus hindustanus]SHG48645.1 hypothetical protein SAMN05444320_109167 [Streptoalloteichus hindustanus]
MPAGPAGSVGQARSVLVAMCLAATVTAAALVVAAALREGTGGVAGGGQGDGADGSAAAVPSGCEGGPCRSVASAEVGGDRVELLADPADDSAWVRVTGMAGISVLETNTVRLGARLTADSLRCTEFARSVCLVRGANGAGELFADVFVGNAGSWSRIDAVYSSDAGYLELAPSWPDGLPDVVTVQRACGVAAAADCGQVVARVHSLGGGDVGCTRPAPTRDQLPGWPRVAPRREQLVRCDY